MKLSSNLLLAGTLLAGILIYGCSNPLNPTGNSQTKETASVEKVKYIYDDKEYEVTFQQTGKGVQILPGPDNAKVEQLLTYPTSGLLKDCNDDNTLWIYKDSSDLKKVNTEISSRYHLSSQPNSVNSLAKTAGKNDGPKFAVLYTDDNYHGSATTIQSSIPVYSPNDAVTSVWVYNCEIVIYQDVNYGGHSIAFYSAPPTYISGTGIWYYNSYFVPNLGSFAMTQYDYFWHDWGSSWNDQLSSVKFYPQVWY